MRFKVHFGKDCRYFKEDNLEYERIVNKIIDVFGIICDYNDHKEYLVIKIKDEDGDLVSVETTEELMQVINPENLSNFGNQHPNQMIRIFVSQKHNNSNNAGAATNDNTDLDSAIADGTSTTDDVMLEILRDIGLYICTRDITHIQSWVSSEKSLITPSLAKRFQSDKLATDYLKTPNSRKALRSSISSNPEAHQMSSPKVTNVSSSSRVATPIYGRISSKLSVQDVCSCLRKHGIEDELISLFQENDINGEVLHQLDNDVLKDMGIKSAGKRLKLIRLINNSFYCNEREE